MILILNPYLLIALLSIKGITDSVLLKLNDIRASKKREHHLPNIIYSNFHKESNFNSLKMFVLHFFNQMLCTTWIYNHTLPHTIMYTCSIIYILVLVNAFLAFLAGLVNICCCLVVCLMPTLIPVPKYKYFPFLAFTKVLSYF